MIGSKVYEAYRMINLSGLLGVCIENVKFIVIN